MDKEYIERDALLEDISESVVHTVRVGYPSPEVRGANKVIDRIKAAPVADVVEVKHGEWQEIDNLVIEHGLPTVKGKTWRCSICGEARKNHTAPDMDYCPNCGAKMDKKEGAESDL